MHDQENMEKKLQKELRQMNHEVMSINPEKFHKVLINVNNHYNQNQIQQQQNVPFLTPSTSMVSLHEKRFNKNKNKNINMDNFLH